MNIRIVLASLALAFAAPMGAQAQGVPGGMAHGVQEGGRIAGPVGAVVGGAVGGVIGGVEGVLGLDRRYYVAPEPVVVRHGARVRHRVARYRSHRVVRHRTVRHRVVRHRARAVTEVRGSRYTRVRRAVDRRPAD